MKPQFFKILFLLLPFISWSQKTDDLISQLKNEDLKVNFENYLKQEAAVLDYFSTNAKPDAENKIEVTNLENTAYFDSIINKLKRFNKSKSFIRNNFYDEKFKGDKIIINNRFKKADSIINANYIARFKIVKTKIQNSTSAKESTIVPHEEYKRLIEAKEMSQPTNESCKNSGLSVDDEANCSANYLRNKIVTHIQNYLSDFEYGVNISSAIQFVIDKDGSLVFDKFIRSTGNLEYDLIVYKGFRSLARTTKFIPAKVKDENVSVFYVLPIRIVIEEY